MYFLPTFQPGQNPKVDHARAIKEYSRSSADQMVPLPQELRPSPVLDMTMTYLMSNIMDVGREGEWADWYEFLWSRTRAIRKVGFVGLDACVCIVRDTVNVNFRNGLFSKELVCTNW